MSQGVNTNATKGGGEQLESTLIEVLAQQLVKLHEAGQNLDAFEIGSGRNTELACPKSRVASHWALFRHASDEIIEQIEDLIAEAPARSDSDVAIKLMLVFGILDTLREECADDPSSQLDRIQQLVASAFTGLTARYEIEISRYGGRHYIPDYSNFLASNRVKKLASQMRQDLKAPQGRKRESTEP